MADPIEERLCLIEDWIACGVGVNSFEGNWLIAEFRALRQRVAEVERERDGLAKALEVLIESGESYMSYHVEKFYGGMTPAPTGITPALAKAREALRAHEPPPERGREEPTNG